MIPTLPPLLSSAFFNPMYHQADAIVLNVLGRAHGSNNSVTCIKREARDSCASQTRTRPVLLIFRSERREPHMHALHGTNCAEDGFTADHECPNSLLSSFLVPATSFPQMVQAACYQLVLDRKLGDYTLPDGWVVIGTGIEYPTILASDCRESAQSLRAVPVDLHTRAWTSNTVVPLKVPDCPEKHRRQDRLPPISSGPVIATLTEYASSSVRHRLRTGSPFVARYATDRCDPSRPEP